MYLAAEAVFQAAVDTLQSRKKHICNFLYSLFKHRHYCDISLHTKYKESISGIAASAALFA